MSRYDFIVEITREAGKLLLRLRDEGFSVSNKGGDPRDVVTSADNEVNDFLITAIKRSFPKDAIFSEEGDDDYGSGDIWALDPIDGTSNFSRGIPHYAVCVGYVEEGVPVMGAVYNPVTDELFHFEKGKGAWLNDNSITVSSETDLKKSTVLFHAGRKPELRTWGSESYGKLLGHAKKTNNLASLGLDVCFVASGRVEAVIYGTASTLDSAAAFGLLTESGGVAIDDEGKTISLSSKPVRMFATNNNNTATALRTLLQ